MIIIPRWRLARLCWLSVLPLLQSPPYTSVIIILTRTSREVGTRSPPPQRRMAQTKKTFLKQMNQVKTGFDHLGSSLSGCLGLSGHCSLQHHRQPRVFAEDLYLYLYLLLYLHLSLYCSLQYHRQLCVFAEHRLTFKFSFILSFTMKFTLCGYSL